MRTHAHAHMQRTLTNLDSLFPVGSPLELVLKNSCRFLTPLLLQPVNCHEQWNGVPTVKRCAYTVHCTPSSLPGHLHTQTQNLYTLTHHHTNMYVCMQRGNVFESYICVCIYVFESYICICIHVLDSYICVSIYVFESYICVSIYVFDSYICVCVYTYIHLYLYVHSDAHRAVLCIYIRSILQWSKRHELFHTEH